MELGLDLDVVDEHGLQQMLHASAPWAALWYKLDPDDDSKGCIEMTPLWVAYQRKVHLGQKGAWWEIPLDVKAGATYSGKPHIELGIGNLPLVLGLAAALLAAGKPVGVRRKEVGGLAVQFGGAGGEWSLQERAELDAQLRRDGRGLRLDFSQINGVLRMRQAD
ncbi:DDT domain-containing [Micractinium conductrix]|uniref:DDT domain-containing n=1 Tax=Micractinium conductrix TaxID=554055 RepID=A0A2P6VFD6_9CHLO|nr:DDT domain-containing [Micractinium conductrix]|eukprot:PSC72805.1 DDT domain-containing [Micractinium conductrix]